MATRSKTIMMEPVPERFAAIYRERGLSVPVMAGPHPEGALIPVENRAEHEAYAKWHGYYWLPCVLCSGEFGGHEITGSVPDPASGANFSQHICPSCTVARKGVEW